MRTGMPALRETGYPTVQLGRRSCRESTASLNDIVIPACVKQRQVENEGKKKLLGLSPQANYTDRATAACS
jgi:hypothetical protein